MEPHPVPASLYELVRLALPVGTTFTADADQRGRSVQWSTIVGLPLRGEVMVDAGDFVFCAVRSAEPNWDKALSDFAKAQVVGVGTADKLPPSALDKAKRLGLPLILLPDGSNVRQAHRSALTLLINRQAQMAQRAAQIYEYLVRLSAEGSGLDGLARALCELTGKSVLVQDKRLIAIASCPTASLQAPWDSVLAELGQIESLPEGWADRKAAATIRTVTHQAVGDGLGRLVTPIAVGQLARGYLSVVGGADELDSFDALVVEQGGAACALEMSRAKAISEATKSLRGDFVDAVLAGAIPPQEIQRWAQRIGHDIAAPHAVVIFAWPEGAGLSLRRMETIVNGEIGLGRVSALIRAGEGEVAAFVALDPENPLKTARDFAQAVHAQAHISATSACIACCFNWKAIPIWLRSSRRRWGP
ncbi:MAG: hypothetical protein HY023_01245 [Chloroflexi bacterium]|nr:hypothetical protein [Chloroflexota bacterium]